MLHIIVAEDEYFARKVLVKMLMDSAYEIGTIREAETGLEALALLRQEKADIVITDIRMPDLDGLELAEKIQQEYPQVRVIIESGYADFNYARNAIRFGVRDYLTKPVNDKELAAAIAKILEEQEKDRQKLALELAQRRGWYMDFAYLLEQEEIGYQVLGQANTLLKEQSWCLSVVQKEKGSLEEEQLKTVLNILAQPVGKLHTSVYYFGAKSEFIILFTGEQLGTSLLETVVRGKIDYCMQQVDVVLRAGISQNHPKTEEFLKSLAVAYREAVYALNQRLLRSREAVFIYENEVNVVQLFDVEQEKNLERSLIEHRTEKAVEVVEDFFARCSRMEDITIYSLFTSVIQMMNVVNRVYGLQRQQEEEETEKGAYLMFSFKTDLYSFYSMEELKSYMIRLIEDVGEEGEPKATMIEDLLQYLERNYQYDISVNELAAHKYFVSPSYLSRLFKAETGENFSKYLMRLRMEKARQLLRETMLKISDIATYVGYNDVSYFIMTFKKQNQMTPEQYRNMPR